jgi:DeoR family transcriptional regulator, fructose operon transcriptional repressor
MMHTYREPKLEGPALFSTEREAIILEKLEQQGRVMVNELAEELDVTTMTIRRDLQRLDQQGLLQKVHGGAVLVSCLPKERPFGEKKLIQTQQKQTIAEKAMELVSAGDTILLDAGTTTFEMACLLHKTPGVHVVTSDLHIAVELCAAEGKLFFIGGEIEKELGRSTGAKALQFLSDIHVDTVFLGISSVSDDLMLGSHSFENAELKRTFLKCGSKKVLVADQNKFGTKAFAQIGPLSLVDVLVTDKGFNEAEMRYFETHDIMLREVR